MKSKHKTNMLNFKKTSQKILKQIKMKKNNI